MGKITTIKLEKETKGRLDKLKEHKRETYNDILKKILHILNSCRKNPQLANSILKNLDINIARIHGYTHEQPEQIKQESVKPIQISIKKQIKPAQKIINKNHIKRK